jgi:hypothetical protein
MVAYGPVNVLAPVIVLALVVAVLDVVVWVEAARGERAVLLPIVTTVATLVTGWVIWLLAAPAEDRFDG